jgi:hypothetical protein
MKFYTVTQHGAFPGATFVWKFSNAVKNNTWVLGYRVSNELLASPDVIIGHPADNIERRHLTILRASLIEDSYANRCFVPEQAKSSFNETSSAVLIHVPNAVVGEDPKCMGPPEVYFGEIEQNGGQLLSSDPAVIRLRKGESIKISWFTFRGKTERNYLQPSLVTFDGENVDPGLPKTTHCTVWA